MKNFIISLILRAVLFPLTLLPIKKDRVLFVSYRGKQYSCSPKAISEALEGKGLEIAWGMHEPEKYKFLSERGIRVLDDRSISFIIYALTARVIVTNTYYKPFLPRRKGQFYLRTWHGGGSYKRVTYPEGLKGRYIRMQQEGASLYLSSSKAFTKETVRETFGYKGEVLECGLPRNDMLLDEDKRLKAASAARKALDIADGARICLYAPTWRDNAVGSAYGLDTEKLKTALSARFGGEWLTVSRGHHALDTEIASKGFDRNADGYPDMQDLLAAADVLITDYSSSVWDMSLTFKPVFLYCTDLASYRSERDFYTDIHEWPFPLAEDNDGLEKNISGFDEGSYREAVKAHHGALGSCESGRASEICAKRIMSVCGGKA